MIKSTIEQVITEDLSEIWQVLTPEEKRIVIENFTIHRFKKNKVIYQEGDEPKYLWCLISGKVKKYKDGVGNRVQILRLIKAVQYFGYRAYFAGELYGSSAMTLEASTLGCIPMEIVEKILQKNVNLAMFFIHELSCNLGNSDTKIVNLTQKHIRGRLAETLMVLLDTYGTEEDDHMTLKIYLGREDLANLSNMTTANAIRTLSNFGDEHLVVVDGRKIKILDEPELRRISTTG